MIFYQLLTFIATFRRPHPRKVELFAFQTPDQGQRVVGGGTVDAGNGLGPLGLHKGLLQQAQGKVILF